MKLEKKVGDADIKIVSLKGVAEVILFSLDRKEGEGWGVGRVGLLKKA